MNVPKTIITATATLLALTAILLAPPALTHLQDNQLIGTTHSEPDPFVAPEAEPTATDGTTLLERLVLFGEGGSDQVTTLAQPLGDEELEPWTKRFRDTWGKLAEAQLVASGPNADLPNITNWGHRTLYWEAATGAAVSTIGIYQTSTSEDGSVIQEGWINFDEESGLPISFYFESSEDNSTNETKKLGDAATAPKEPQLAAEPSAYAAWLGEQWGLEVKQADNDPNGTRFIIDGTATDLTVYLTQSPFSLEVMLGSPTADYGSTINAREALDQELNDQLGYLNN